MAITNGSGGLGAPGTKIIKSESEGSETKTNVSGAVLFGLFGDLLLVCLTVIAALGGWPSTIPALIGVSLLMVWFCLWFFKVPKFFVIHVPLTRWSLGMSHEIILKMTFLTSIACGIIFGRDLWNWITAQGALRTLIVSTASAYVLPKAVYLGAGAFLVVMIFIGRWKRGVGLLLLGALIRGGYFANTSWAVASAWDVLAARARYLAIPFVVPWIGSALMMMLTTAKNMMFPYLDFNLRPVGFDEVREVGLAGLWLPKLLSKAPQEPTPDRFIKVEVSERNGKTRAYIDLPNTSEFVEFCKSVYHGKSFALRTARAVGLSRKEFEKIRDAFIQRGWACWVNKGSRNQGVDLLVAGKRVVENIALDRTVG